VSRADTAGKLREVKSGIPVLALLLVACAEPAAPTREAVVYGVDGRTEVYAETNAALRAVAETSIAMKMGIRHLDETDPSNVRITYTRTLGEAHMLCAGEAFADQIDPGTCSGTLIDSQHILTAGHCMDAATDCTNSAWVFGYRYVADGVIGTLTSDDVYRCAGVLAYFDDGFVDHAVVRLDRPVVGHSPATSRLEPSGIANGTGIALIGHPNGIPMKIDSGGLMTWSSADLTRFHATVDAFAGNSGSGVFDLSGDMVGVLRGGETDYVAAGACNIVNVIDPPPTDDGESLVYLRPALTAFCMEPGVVSPVCSCSGPCVPSPPGDVCDDATVVEPISQTIDGTLVAFAPDTRGTCGGAGPDRVYTFTLTERTAFSAETAGMDTVLYLRPGCDGSEIACNDDIDRDTNRASFIQGILVSGTYALFVDAYDADIDAFTLTLTFDDPNAGLDAGPAPTPDAGPPTPDAGTAEIDAGTPEPTGAGCGCRTAPRGTAPLGWLVAMLAVVALRRRLERASGAPPDAEHLRGGQLRKRARSSGVGTRHCSLLPNQR
jgi:MYXO-CTERM domain-containing protein